MGDRSADQERWDRYGTERLRRIERDPAGYIISDCPIGNRQLRTELMSVLSPLQGKHILELGCGRGDFAVWLAKQDAKVTAVDLGPRLVAAARALARVNCVDCDFRTASIVDLPFEPDTFDAEVGLRILHHLSEADVRRALQGCHRVLKPGGVAVFYEPVENSAAFGLIQNLVPVGKKGGRRRPSILQRKAWRAYVQTLDDRQMTSGELIADGEGLFRGVRTWPHGFLIRLVRLLGGRWRGTVLKLDRFLFRVFPPLRHYCKNVLVSYRK